MTAYSESIQFIPLNRLVVSPRNVRRKDRKADIDALAASIASVGLLQNLCVAPVEGDRFEVDAGGRRLQALKLLAKQGKIAKNFDVPCHVGTAEQSREISLAENVHRIAMDAMDEVDAYAALLAEGATSDEVAHRFGVTRRHVDQRLALSGLSPKIKAAWKRGDINLDVARAFCLVNDHAQQEAVFRSLSRPITNAGSVRTRMVDGRVKASDRLAVFVGIDAYETAGGKVLRDLFEADAAFIEDPALLMKLAEDKLDAHRSDWLAQGWSWAEINLAGGRGEGVSLVRLQPEWREATDLEQAELDRIETALDELDAALEANSSDDDPRWSTRDDLEAEYETIRQAARCWDSELKAYAGVQLSIDHDGAVVAIEGLVRLADEKRVETLLKGRRAPASETADEAGHADVIETDGSRSRLPKAVARDLTLVRTRAIRQALAGDADLALAVCVAAMAHRAFRHGEMSGVGLGAHLRPVDDPGALADSRAALETELPDDQLDALDWALGLCRDRLLATLAIIVAGAIDLAHDNTSSADLGLQALGDRLAQHLDIDMTQYWRADIGYWLRLPKSSLIDALMEASEAPAGSRRRDDLLKSYTKERKDALAAKTAALHERSGYLPCLLVTPLPTGAVAVTSDGLAALAVATPVIAAE